ncbi:sodium:solute symporter family transporter [Pseudoalteromonas luteoviolacea]|uniref:Sodium:solute symporter n=1 Tax=Pseudoalteromonas luteoviolacea S4054 TaxID=1129367 RepID=A0A0F6AIM8_9GAMM|nr:sodium:solute symporter [Pseudoalteromonas luteoviolacea]AOT08854.1 sodium:solute symporter [Pseudoalteromonas luteoviolacea]AOT13767.1 sodium:solute symporter [Pseudoalteromonas luteoviolacea]AOT18681.1 sodium:solute symporter [Pseudoalteromonas luteoviolacea]KKE85464.1 sodium:solute symporter [Pseudoalteromonas luteoviolacea S4054]KZN67978.1 sodium:solute symporter [Pseudoalteromonas luteoviolacea S4047-1]
MLDITTALISLVVFAALFSIPGLIYARRCQDKLDDFLVARNSQNSQATMLTLMATTMGTWVLFGPAESATWGGIGAVIGYALGVLAPRLIMIPLGARIRTLMPEGHTLTEFVYNRYGKGLYVFVLLIMLFYLFIGLTAGLTGIAKMVALVSPVPLWATAAIVMFATLLYTLYGGLRVTIFTDRLQMLVILPFIALIIGFGWAATDGIAPALNGLAQNAPHLIDPFNATGIETGLTFFIAVVLTGLFYQGAWQRVFAARDNKVVRNAFILSGVLSFPIIIIMGLFGLAFVGLGLPGQGSTALFSVILDTVPYWFMLGLIPFGLALIMSSADSSISGLNSILVVDLHRLMPQMSAQKLLKISRWLIVLMSIPVLITASQGFSILYLFLLADLLCCAAAFPVFFGFYNGKYQSYNAALSISGGLLSGLYLFPMPGEPLNNLLESFLLASLVPVAISLLLLILPSKNSFDFTLLASKVKPIES